MTQIKPNDLRKLVLKMVYEKKSGHIGGSFSIAEIIAHLYNNYNIPDHDKLILSKGHAVPIMYAALYLKGKISEQELSTFREIDSRLQGHPDQLRLPEVTATTGSLGQGLSIAIGHAMALKLKGSTAKVFCIVGDGEMQEGQIWEALNFAGNMQLSNLYCILDDNEYQSDGPSINNLPLIDEKMISSFKWEYVKSVYGNTDGIATSINLCHTDMPKFLHLITAKGAGVSFMTGKEWHARVPTKEEYEKAMKELDNGN